MTLNVRNLLEHVHPHMSPNVAMTPQLRRSDNHTRKTKSFATLTTISSSMYPDGYYPATSSISSPIHGISEVHPLHEIMSQELQRQRTEIEDLKLHIDDTEVERQLEREIHRENDQQRISQLEEEVRRLKERHPEISPQDSPTQCIMKEPEVEEEVELMKKFIGKLLHAQQMTPPSNPEASAFGESTPREGYRQNSDDEEREAKEEWDAMTGFLNHLESTCQQLSQQLTEREEECARKDKELAMLKEQMKRMTKSMKAQNSVSSAISQPRGSWDVPVPTAIVIDDSSPTSRNSPFRSSATQQQFALRARGSVAMNSTGLHRQTTGCTYPLPVQRANQERSSVSSVPAEISRSIVTNFQKLFSSANK